MITLVAPGVYRNPAVAKRREIGLVRTDVAAFAGFAERGPLGPETPLPLISWDEYRAQFGGYIANGYLPWAVRAFFENQGTTCYVTRIAASASTSSAVVRASLAGTTTLTAAAGPELTLADASAVRAGDLLTVTTDGIAEPAVAASIDGAVVTLADAPANVHAAGDLVTIFRRGFVVRARSAGQWGNRLRLLFTPLEEGDAVERLALRVTCEPSLGETHPEEEFFARLSLLPNDENYAPRVLARSSRLIDLDVPEGATPTLLASTTYATLAGGGDGLNDVTPQHFIDRLRAFEDLEDVSFIAVPDAVWRGNDPIEPPPPPAPDPCAAPPGPPPVLPPPDVSATPPALSDGDTRRIYTAVIEQCVKLRDRLAILDTPDHLHPGKAETWLRGSGLKTRLAKFAALYYPWLKVPDASVPGALSRRIPPSGHVAGQWAANDARFGVQHPPANEPIDFAVDVGEVVTDRAQEGLNNAGINAIRAFPGRGIRIWGARSISEESQWKFIHVRRLMSYIEECVEKSTQWTVFEPNDANLRRTLTHSLSVFLEGIWSAGGLRGNAASEAFYVKCDETNNTTATIDAGLLVCEVGVAVAAPMEFIVFEIRRSVSGSQVVEE